ncbi:hypothetical protein D3C86_1070820 [compost metagenome]
MCTGRCHVTQGSTALERTGEAHGLNCRMLDQRLADATAVDHVEHAGRHPGFLGGSNDRVSHPFSRGHVTAVGLEHHRAPGGQRRGGIAAGGRERQRKIAGTEHRHRSQADAVLTQVRTRQRLTLRQCPVDSRAVEITAPQDFGKQAHLPAGASTLALNPAGGQRRLAADHRDKIITEGIQFIGNGLEKLRPPLRAQAAIDRIRGRRRAGRRIDFLHCRLGKIVGQGLPRRRIDTLQLDAAGGAALAADVVVTKDPGHG